MCDHDANGRTMDSYIRRKTRKAEGSTLIAPIGLHSSSCLTDPVGAMFDLGRIHLNDTRCHWGVC